MGILGETDVDSFRVIFLVDNAVVTVDILGNTDAEGAREAAITIATAQVSCLQGNSCEVPDLPATLIVDESGTPIPDPVG